MADMDKNRRRLIKSMPAPSNLEIPPHKYLSDSRLLIGDDGNGQA